MEQCPGHADLNPSMTSASTGDNIEARRRCKRGVHPQPLALDPSNTTATIGFSCRVEGRNLRVLYGCRESPQCSTLTLDLSANLSDQTAEPGRHADGLRPGRLEGRCKWAGDPHRHQLVENQRVRILGKTFEVRTYDEHLAIRYADPDVKALGMTNPPGRRSRG